MKSSLRQLFSMECHFWWNRRRENWRFYKLINIFELIDNYNLFLNCIWCLNTAKDTRTSFDHCNGHWGRTKITVHPHNAFWVNLPACWFIDEIDIQNKILDDAALHSLRVNWIKKKLNNNNNNFDPLSFLMMNYIQSRHTFQTMI